MYPSVAAALAEPGRQRLLRRPFLDLGFTVVPQPVDPATFGGVFFAQQIAYEGATQIRLTAQQAARGREL